ncbi:DUF6483 family protein [Paenibacillus filicis]|uniref:DUF6483 family protein n=1 Tax=Paenibacillus filicis TaxID=669464 RepID=A0ABU9DQ24_9BACL
MYQRDYIMRLIEQTAKIIGQVINKRGQALQERLEIINQAMKRLVGLDSRLLQALAVRDLLELISQGGRPDIGKALALSDMMIARGRMLKEEQHGEQAARESIRWAELLLLVRADEEDSAMLKEIDERIEAALELAGRSPMGTELLELLIPYYEETGRLSKAEDALFHRLAVKDGDEPSDSWLVILENGLLMYERWTLLSEPVLTAGGLSAPEVAQSQKELIEMKNATVNKR